MGVWVIYRNMYTGLMRWEILIHEEGVDETCFVFFYNWVDRNVYLGISEKEERGGESSIIVRIIV